MKRFGRETGSGLYRSLPLEFHLAEVTQARSYRIVIARDPSFKAVVKECEVGLQETPRISGLDDGTYYVQTRSVDNLGLEGFSSAPGELVFGLSGLFSKLLMHKKRGPRPLFALI